MLAASPTESEEYDFIVVGAGPAGCAVAAKLAASALAPKVLLVESGDSNQDANLRLSANRQTQYKNPAQSWAYTSAPEPSLDNRELEVVRGKGLGGSSAINFAAWTEGPRDDMERMADVTGDESWRWENVKERYRKLTAPDVDGSVRINYPTERNSEILQLLNLFSASGVPVHREANVDNPLGMAIYPLTLHQGLRSTAADLVHDLPGNLTIRTSCTVYRVLFDGTVAIGVITHDGQTLRARNEVIISCGSMDSPKILMHSGIGPADQLAAFNIPVLHENAHVGQNFQDHIAVVLGLQRPGQKHAASAELPNEAATGAVTEAEASRMHSSVDTIAIGFFKSETTMASDEFEALPSEEKKHMKAPTIPHYEIGLSVAGPEHAPLIAAVLLILQNLQSRGSFTLQSSDPSVPLEFKTGYLGRLFDQRLAIESMRDVMRYLHSDAFQQDHLEPINEPSSTSEEDILRFWRKNVVSACHASGTCSMGTREDGANRGVVDRGFRVYGVRGLRVADCSVFPFIPSAHIQAHAYQVGLIAAEKILADYQLG
ncbi:hypothetical protein NQ176_g3052 [Zarea fungicola]|uniref:Uncharacterized protein n=1 Tax=Zarea fungicola TaxID=93591 RepID=A0ACC1NLH9_9HYPO|nr:hypothetical protein NQ176_g3052 [Lecanicillium fungicola]